MTWERELDRALEAGDERGAIALLRAHIEQDPDDADAQHLLGELLLGIGRPSEAAAVWERVRTLDAEQDLEAGIASSDDRRRVEVLARRALDLLPDTFAVQIADVPIVLEERPSAHLVSTGFDPRAYGLFEGPTSEERGMFDTPASPTRIVVYWVNLVADFPDDDDLTEQVGITVAHEIGHYFGLDEDDMERLGLD